MVEDHQNNDQLWMSRNIWGENGGCIGTTWNNKYCWLWWTSEFDVFQAPYVLQNAVCSKTISKLVRGFVETKIISYGEVVDKLYGYAWADFYTGKSAKSSIWKCLLNITGLSERYSINKLVKHQDLYKELPGMSGYEWYSNNGIDNGITVLYPDKQTFAVLMYPDIKHLDYSQFL